MAERLSNVVRRRFVEFFTSKHGHKFVKSSSVVPDKDSSLSFVNAGMNQFKPLFLADHNSYSPSRVCNYQRCIRVGGKTCDLDQIGLDFRHHTFFEMLGNWSFNDYGKQQACEWALEFLINELKINPDKLVMTYFSSNTEEDLETRDIWLKLGIANERILANRKGENFWEMGPSGPCGISTEIFYPVGGELVEIWNLVFIDRQRLAGTGEMKPLRGHFVDTGMGLERILSVLENVNSNYDTDLFRGLIKIIESKSDARPYKGTLSDEIDINYRILADHCRMITVALADGIEPGRRDAGFNLRSIIKKATLISRDVFQQETPRYLLFDLVDETIETLSEAYPELTKSVKSTRRTLASETKRYLGYLDRQSETLAEPPAKLIRLPTIKRALSISEPDQLASYIVSGRVENFRTYKSFNFVDLVDGTTRDKLQVVLDKSLMKKPELGAYLSCQGYLVPSRGEQQSFELKADKIHYVSQCDPHEYPLAAGETDSTSEDWYRRYIHLRPRTEHFAALLRVRSELEFALHMIMKQMDFLRVHTPILSSNDSEASSDLFVVNRSKIMHTNDVPREGRVSQSGASFPQPTLSGPDIAAASAMAASHNAADGHPLRSADMQMTPMASGPTMAHADASRIVGTGSEGGRGGGGGGLGRGESNQSGGNKVGEPIRRSIRADYFNNKDVFLITSAQLHLETLAASLGRVYSLSAAFRAEHSISTKHLCEFTMFEVEESNLIELSPLMDRAESIIKFVAQFLSEVSEHKLDFHHLMERNSNEPIYNKLARSTYIRMSYREALDTLRDKTDFTGNLSYGSDIGRAHERRLLEYCDNVPIFITNYPKRLKPFYMKTTSIGKSNDDDDDGERRRRQAGSEEQEEEALCFDLIGPFGGELCGGSLREDSYEKLVRNLRLGPESGAAAARIGSQEEFAWYLDSRRFGSFPHGGFGMGIERLIQSLLGVKNIKDTLAFPRWPGHCPA